MDLTIVLEEHSETETRSRKKEQQIPVCSKWGVWSLHVVTVDVVIVFNVLKAGKSDLLLVVFVINWGRSEGQEGQDAVELGGSKWEERNKKGEKGGWIKFEGKEDPNKMGGRN